ncbi:hypothetical protein MSTE_01977 [Mycobacteroides stephanolepidis]|uniref:Uncharacterized protein n=1 Tax=[Mycobacterium] stephanolepidis TaxID=1520670 RepID=A0A1Z4EWG0_9MYCO|nr:hypothetical protein MSTE_01977 [[Mycobacterium] stephanolepidis]
MEAGQFSRLYLRAPPETVDQIGSEIVGEQKDSGNRRAQTGMTSIRGENIAASSFGHRGKHGSRRGARSESMSLGRYLDHSGMWFRTGRYPGAGLQVRCRHGHLRA